MNEPKNRRILVVDDNPAIHEDFRKILGQKNQNAALDQLESELFGEQAREAESYELASAYQGQDALAMVQAGLRRGEHYALTFVDMRMPPGWNGVETIAKLWEVDPEIQVVICTAYSDCSWEEILTRLGATDRLLILKKPFDTAEVCQLACALTEKWHLTRHAHLKLNQLKGMVDEQTHELRVGNARLRSEISERAALEQSLRTSETRYALAAAAANDGLWDWDLAGARAYFSPRWKGLLGHADHEVGADPDEWFDRVHPDDLDRVRGGLREHVEGRSEAFQCEYRIRHRDGQYRWMSCRGLSVRDGASVAVRVAGSQTDITDRRMAEEQLRHDAFHDALTGLSNRALIVERVSRCLARSRRDPGHRFALLFLDLDRFKWINDSLGHLVGDQFLVAVARRLVACVRGADSPARAEHDDVARLGGDEFVVLLDGLSDEADALRVADRLQAALAEPTVIDGREVHASTSIGVVVGRAGYAKPEELLRDADTALYQAKARGRGCYAVFDDSMHASAMSRWWIENELRRAVERDELRLVYQPVVCLRTGELLEFEALLRWQHPERGPIPPSDFIPIAEEAGLIGVLGEWVLTRAIGQLRSWDRLLAGRSRFSVAVNVSGKQLSQPELADFVARRLAESGVSPDRLRLEVTEGALMEKGPSADVMARLRAMGVRFHLDDFGTGFSSLSYLHRIPVEAVKIDRSFVNEMTRDHTSASIVQTIVTLAHTLGALVIAEGVETQGQLDQLRLLGCDQAQGYFFNRPLEVAVATDLLRPAEAAAAG